MNGLYFLCHIIITRLMACVKNCNILRMEMVYERQPRTKIDLPILAIELDGREHQEKSVVMECDSKKNQICREYGFELIRIENTYARRYQYMKNILMKYFASVK